MTCGIVGYGPKILDPEKDAEYSRAFINHLKPLLIEIYCNGYDTFLCRLGRGCEIRTAEAILNINSYFDTMELHHVQVYKGYHDCRYVWELEQLKHVSRNCSRHICITGNRVSADEISIQYERYYLKNANMLLAIYTPAVAVPEIDSLIEKISSQNKVLICMNPFSDHFDITYYHKPSNWHA